MRAIPPQLVQRAGTPPGQIARGIATGDRARDLLTRVDAFIRGPHLSSLPIVGAGIRFLHHHLGRASRVGSVKYSPITPYVAREANQDGLMHIDARPGFQRPPSTREELIHRHRIDREDAERILAGRLTIMSIGRSGFVDEDDSIYFRRVMEGYFDGAFHLLRRAGVDLTKSLAMTTSATAGSIDLGVRRLATYHRVPAVAFINDYMAQWVDPRDPFMPGIMDTGPGYSSVSIGMSDVVLALPGGNFSLYNDIPEAIALGKEVILVKNQRIPKIDKSVVDGTERIGNHGLILIHDKDDLTQKIRTHFQFKKTRVSDEQLWDPNFSRADEIAAYILENFPQSPTVTIVQKINAGGLALTPQQFWSRITIVSNHKQWAAYLWKKLGHTESLEEAIAARVGQPVASGTQSLAGTKINIAFTGRSQLINKTSGDAEITQVENILKLLRTRLTDGYGFARRDIGIIHGMSNYGADGVVLNILSRRGFPSIGIVKPEWAAWTNDKAQRKSDYVLTEDTYEAFSRGFMGEGLGFQTDVLVVFEGNAGVKEHIKAAVRKGIPVIVVPLTDDPLFGTFFDVQKQRQMTNRLLNIGKWVLQSERAQALPVLYGEIFKLTGVNLKPGEGEFPLKQVQARVDAQLRDLSATSDVGQKQKLTLARDLIAEALDMLDLSTTVDDNARIMVTSDPSEIAGLIHGVYAEKISAPSLSP